METHTYYFGRIGAGKVVHELARGDEYATLCGKVADTFVSDEDKESAKFCASCDVVAQNQEKEDTMPPRKRAAAPPAEATFSENTSKTDEARADVQAVLDALSNCADTSKAEALFQQGEVLLLDLPGSQKASLRMKLKAAWADAKQRAANAATPPAGTAVAVTSYHDVPEVDDLVKAGAEKLRSGVVGLNKTATLAKEIAHTLLFIKVRIPNKRGLPDLKGTMQITRDAAAEMYASALEGLDKDDPDVQEAHATLRRAVNNRSADVVVEYLRALNQPESAEEFAARFPELAGAEGRPEDAVRALYAGQGIELPEHTRSEQSAIALRRRLELEAKVKDGKATPEEVAEATGEAVEKEETPAEYVASIKSKIARATRGIDTAKIEAASDEERRELREDLEKQLKLIRAAIAAAI